MKHITAIILTLAMLCAVSCNDGTTAPDVTTVGSDAPIAPQETTTAPVTEEKPVDITTLLEGYTLHELSSDELESFRAGFPSDSALGKIAVKVTDYDGLYLLIDDEGVTEDNDGGYYRAKVHRVICDGTVQDCDVPFVFGPDGFELLKTDEYTVVGRYWYDSYYYIFHKGGCTYMPIGFGRDGGSPSLYVEDGVLKYSMRNPKYAKMQAVYPVLDIIEDEHEWRYEWGTVSIENGKAVLTKTKEQLWSDDDYLRETFEDVKGNVHEFSGEIYDFTQFDTLEELLEYNKLKAEVGETAAFLSTIPVYEYSYENYEYANEFDRIAEDEYAKFEAGEVFAPLYGVRIAEYPDVVLIGQVITEPELQYEYQKRGLNSVIHNGERYYTPEYNDGVPGYGVSVTDDFICVTSATNHYAHAYFIHDGGVEYINFFDSEFARALDRLYVSDGVMNYSCYSTQYSSVRFTPASLYTEYKSPEDCLYYEGTIELEDGKIKLNTKSYTVSEWYATKTDLHEKSGTTDVAEFVAWLEGNMEKEDVQIDPIRMYKPRS